MTRKSAFTRIVLAAALVTAAGATHSTNDMRAVGVFAMSMMCTYQDPTYRDSAFGRTWEGYPGFQGWKATSAQPLAQCFRRRQWLPASICRSVVDLDYRNREQLDAWFSANAAALEPLEPVFVFFNDVLGNRVSKTSCPEIELKERK